MPSLRDTSTTQTGAAIFKPVAQPRLYVAVAREITLYIRNTPLEPGAQLPPERDLARQFQVSRTTVREAMIALETAGLIEVRVGDGTYVRNRPAHLHFPWDREADPGPGPHEQFRVRLLAECAAAEDAAANITGAELETLAELVAAMAEDVDGPDAETYRERFHRVIAAASRNSILEAMIIELWRLRGGEMWRALSHRVVKPEHHILALEDRRDILAALEHRDGSGAAEAMRRLLSRIRQRYFDD